MSELAIKTKRWLTTADLCQHYGVDRSTVWRWVQAGKLPSPDRTLGRARWPVMLIEARDQQRAEAVQ